MAISIRDVPANGWRFRCRVTASSGDPVILLKGPYRFVEWDAGHRLAHERRSDVTRELLAHFRAFPLSGTPAP